MRKNIAAPSPRERRTVSTTVGNTHLLLNDLPGVTSTRSGSLPELGRDLELLTSSVFPLSALLSRRLRPLRSRSGFSPFSLLDILDCLLSVRARLRRSSFWELHHTIQPRRTINRRLNSSLSFVSMFNSQLDGIENYLL